MFDLKSQFRPKYTRGSPNYDLIFDRFFTYWGEN